MEYVIVVLGILLLIWICCASDKPVAKKYRKGDMSIRPEEDGKYSVYEKENETPLYNGSLADCEQWITENTEQ